MPRLLTARGLILVSFLSVLLCMTLVYQFDQFYGLPSKLALPKFPQIPYIPFVNSRPSPLPDSPSDKLRASASASKPDQTKHAEPSKATGPSVLIDPGQALSAAAPSPTGDHPIDYLISNAAKEHQKLLDKETRGTEEAAEAYRKRRGRHPPPLFDEWVEYAERRNAVMVEDFWDRIYNDIEPLWAIPADKLREAALAWPHVISIRNGITSLRSAKVQSGLRLWEDMISKVAQYLPDVDLALNEMDVSRMHTPWEAINQYMTVSGQRKADALKLSPAEIISKYSTRGDHSYKPDKFKHGLVIGKLPLWSLARESCPPDSRGRPEPFDFDIEEPAAFPKGLPNGTYHGFVSNWTLAKDPCYHSHLSGLHGSFVEPVEASRTTKLFGLFGGSKMSMNNDILLPSALYWDDKGFSAEKDDKTAWKDKQSRVIWRGSASGGKSRDKTWRRFHRHRFLSVNNGTQISLSQQAITSPAEPGRTPRITWSENFAPPTDVENIFNVTAMSDRLLAPWVDSFSNTGFIDAPCYDEGNEDEEVCGYTGDWFKLREKMSMKKQFGFKYLPDIDGDGLSGKYREYLKSESLPLKATIYNEWHDSRLVPWWHFVPLDNTFVDYWGIMDYFVGYDPSTLREDQRKYADPNKKTAGNDDMAHLIATHGREWARRVLRKDDMLIYVYRLLLEYARVADDNRGKMGFVGDLINKKGSSSDHRKEGADGLPVEHAIVGDGGSDVTLSSGKNNGVGYDHDYSDDEDTYLEYLESGDRYKTELDDPGQSDFDGNDFKERPGEKPGIDAATGEHDGPGYGEVKGHFAPDNGKGASQNRR